MAIIFHCSNLDFFFATTKKNNKKSYSLHAIQCTHLTNFKFYFWFFGKITYICNRFNFVLMPTLFKHIKTCPAKIFNFYANGFRQMTVGRTLWLIILLKLIIMFAILKIFLFPDFLGGKCKTDEDKANYVRSELSNRN